MVLDIFYENVISFVAHVYPITINQEDNLRRKGLRKTHHSTNIAIYISSLVN